MSDIVKYTLTPLVGYALGCLSLAPVATPRALLHAQQPPRAFSPAYDPVRDLGALFRDVQLGSVFPDSKTFVDAKPRLAPAEIMQRYAAEKGKPGFSLTEFVTRHFDVPRAAASSPTDRAPLMEQHITALWPMLTRTPDTSQALHFALLLQSGLRSDLRVVWRAILPTTRCAISNQN